MTETRDVRPPVTTCALRAGTNRTVGPYLSQKSRSGSSLTQELGYGHKLVLTRGGGLLVDGHQNVRQEWKWDRRAQNAGSLPRVPCEVVLNPALTLEFHSRRRIDVRFRCRGLERVRSGGVVGLVVVVGCSGG